MLELLIGHRSATLIGPLALMLACGGSSSTTAGDSSGGSGAEASGGSADGGSAGDGDIGSTGDGGTLTIGGANGDSGGSTTTGAGGSSGDNTFDDPDVCIDGDTECTNCMDDDGDGKVDAHDPECSGPLDDDESSFGTGIPGDNIDFCQDCFFDGNSGHDGGEDGDDDGCAYHTDCLYGEEPSGAGMADCFSCSVSDRCVDSCRPYTPNGCDCFGCCEVHTPNGEAHTVLLSDTCTLEQVDDEDACVPCVQSTECRNDCGRCELCIGKTTIPDDCYPGGTGGSGTGGSGTGGGGGTGQVCEDGQEVCNEETPCPSSHFCLTGCCVEVIR